MVIYILAMFLSLVTITSAGSYCSDLEAAKQQARQNCGASFDPADSGPNAPAHGSGMGGLGGAMPPPTIDTPLEPSAEPKKTGTADFDSFEFLKSVGCSQLPMGTCEFLDPENAKNIMLTWNAVLLNHFCGQANPNNARQMLAADAAPEPEACRRLLHLPQ
jgi:hypothetical protein